MITLFNTLWLVDNTALNLELVAGVEITDLASTFRTLWEHAQRLQVLG